MAEPRAATAQQRHVWHRRARHALGHSLRWRLVLLFWLLAFGLTAIFLLGMQRALSIGWRDAARPLVVDYVDRLSAEIGSPPSVERAQALVQTLPITVRIEGPAVNWQSYPAQGEGVRSSRWLERRDARFSPRQDDWQEAEPRLLQRLSADGHRIEFGLNLRAWQERPRVVGWFTLGALLLLTALAYAYVRRLLRPLDDIQAGARRYGAGDFAQPIALRRRDELGDLAESINTMARDIHQMLEAKRALLLAISHELRSPLTRARLNTELLPETPQVHGPRQALLRDLAEMRDLIADLLESERLATRHAALHLEDTDLGALARDLLAQVDEAEGAGDAPDAPGQSPRQHVQLELAPGLPTFALDRARIRLMLRNLLGNALRHGAGAVRGPVLSIALSEPDAAPRQPGGVPALRISMRDFGPGVDESELVHLGEPFYRPDAARDRATGGVGLGLYLCKLVALAHGGTLQLHDAHPGLMVSVTLPTR